MNQNDNAYFQAVSSDGVRLCVRASGPPAGMPILFLHGFSQSHLSWRRQFEGPLAHEFRLIACDLRGHGWSDKPDHAGAYRDPHRWADDVAAVLHAAGVARAVLVGWSYGGRVILNYAEIHGTAAIAGINFVAGVIADAAEYYGARIGTLRATASDDPATSIDGTRRFLRSCFAREPDAPDFERMLSYNAMVPPSVRAKLLGRGAGDDALLESLAMPVLFTQGSADLIVSPAMSAYGTQIVPGAKLSIYENVGHSPFFESQERFDRELTDFVRTCAA